MRDIYIVYNLIDLQRCIKEWQNRDPRKMIREDPREEVLLMRIRTVEMQLAGLMAREKSGSQARLKMLFRLGFLRRGLLFLAIMCVFIALQTNIPSDPNAIDEDAVAAAAEVGVDADHTVEKDPNKVLPSLFFYWFTSSKQFLSAVSLLMGSIFCTGVQRRKVNYCLRERLAKAHAVCKKLHNHVVNFRLESEDQRAEKLDAELDDMKKYYGLGDEDVDYSIYKKKKLNFAQWFARVTSQRFVPQTTYDEIRESESYFPRQIRDDLPGGARQNKLEEKLISESNPHKIGKVIKTGSMNKLAKIAGQNFDPEKEIALLDEYERKAARRARRRQLLVQEGYAEADIESSDLHTSNQSSDEDLDQLDDDHNGEEGSEKQEMALAVRDSEASNNNSQIPSQIGRGHLPHVVFSDDDE